MLLADDEPGPFQATEEHRPSPFFITCDHAGRRLPRALGTLGVAAADLERHIAWDIGAAGVANKLGELLGAFVITQRYSRLVIDCNRPLDAPGSIVARSEATDIPGNRGVTEAEAKARAQAVFHPYHARIRAELDARRGRGQATIFIAMHSFTPVFLDQGRSWHCGVLYNRDPRLGRALLGLLRQDPALVVGDNEPYAVSDLTDFGVVEYGERRGLPHVEFEIRQDLIADEAGQAEWARKLAELLPRASGMFPA